MNDGQMDGIDGWMDGWMGQWMDDGQMDGMDSLNTERPKIQSLWTPYLEFFLKDHVDHLFKIVQDSLGRLIQVITVDGRVHLFSGVM